MGDGALAFSLQGHSTVWIDSNMWVIFMDTNFNSQSCLGFVRAHLYYFGEKESVTWNWEWETRFALAQPLWGFGSCGAAQTNRFADSNTPMHCFWLSGSGVARYGKRRNGPRGRISAVKLFQAIIEISEKLWKLHIFRLIASMEPNYISNSSCGWGLSFEPFPDRPRALFPKIRPELFLLGFTINWVLTLNVMLYSLFH